MNLNKIDFENNEDVKYDPPISDCLEIPRIDRLRIILSKYCWIPFKKEQAPLGRTVLLRLRCKKGDTHFVFGELAESYEDMEVTHWLEILYSTKD